MATCLDCTAPTLKGKRRCGYHWLLKQPIEVQVRAARRRLAKNEAAPGFVRRARVPKDQWPDGARWCAGCQSFVPLFYTRGSRCVACSSAAAHASHVARTYDLAPGEYDALLRAQGGRCYVCGQRPGARRLAVDHDHLTGEVRGLLCASDEWGCNHRLVGAIEGRAPSRAQQVALARRLLAYFEHYPLERLRGLPAPDMTRPAVPVRDDGPPPF